MIRYVADLHFGHENMIRMDGRPFESVSEMDEALVHRWNEVVGDDDEVYVLGDFCYKSSKDPSEYLKRLKGRKRLIVGNHDGRLVKNRRAAAFFESIDELLTINDGNRQVVLCHYPIAEWAGYFRGAYHVYGHVHNNFHNDYWKFMKTQERALNAGCMVNGYAPATLEELIRNNERIRKENP